MTIQAKLPFPVIGPDVDGWFTDSPEASIVVQKGIERAQQAILAKELAPGQIGIIELSIKHQNNPYYLEIHRYQNSSSDQYSIDIFASQVPTPTEKIKIII